MIIERKLELVNQIIEWPFLTENKTIIKYTEQYTIEKELDTLVFDQINYIRLHKRIGFPTELVGARGRERTDGFTNLEVKSLLK